MSKLLGLWLSRTEVVPTTSVLRRGPEIEPKQIAEMRKFHDQLERATYRQPISARQP
jgi:hypothetical protein